MYRCPGGRGARITKAESGCQGSRGDTQRRITLMGSEPNLTNPTAGKKGRGQEGGRGVKSVMMVVSLFPCPDHRPTAGVGGTAFGTVKKRTQEYFDRLGELGLANLGCLGPEKVIVSQRPMQTKVFWGVI